MSSTAPRRTTRAAPCASATTPPELAAGSQVAAIYDALIVEERHRHRYEVNIRYRNRLEAKGLRFSGLSPDGALPEIVEVEDHPWFIGVQFHPELRSRPFDPHPAVQVLRGGCRHAVAAGLMREVAVGPVRFGNRLPLALIAGPCAIEGRAHALETAEALAAMTARLRLPFVYKSSYDKANRTGAGSPRGVGMEAGLEILAELRERFGCPVLTDVHEPGHCAPAAEAVDISCRYRPSSAARRTCWSRRRRPARR